MHPRLWRAALPALAALAIVACQPQAGAGPDDGAGPAAATSAARAFAPAGMDDATVVIRPEGDVIVVAVDGTPVMRGDKGTVVTAAATGDEFDRVHLKPGRHMLTLGMLGSGSNLVDVAVEAKPGDYIFTVLEAVSAGRPLRVLAVIEGGSDGRVIAASTPALVGRTRAEAQRLLAATPEERQRILATEKPGGEQRAEQARAYFNQGRQYLQQGQMENALRAFDGAVGAAPDFVPAHTLRGIVLMNLRRFDEAEAALNRSISLKPGPQSYAARANLYFFLGRMKQQQGDAGQARALFERTRQDADAGLALAGGDVALWSIKSGAHFGLGDGKEGCRAAEKACEFGNCSIIEEYKQCKDGS